MSYFFFFNDTATTEIYTLSLHDALPIYSDSDSSVHSTDAATFRSSSTIPASPNPNDPQYEQSSLGEQFIVIDHNANLDRKSTRLNSSHSQISYAVFCLKQKT